MAAVNNVTRLLDAKGIKYSAFELPAEKLSAIDTARRLGVDPRIVFKTIVVIRPKPKRTLLVLVPAGTTVDLKLLASAVGERSVTLARESEAENLTGLQTGGISPLALLNRRFDVLIDASARHWPEIHISGGQRGLNIRLPVDDLVGLTGAHFGSVARQDDVP